MILVNPNLQLEELENGVKYNGKFYSYRTLSLSAVTKTKQSPLNTRWYIKQCTVGIRTVAGDTTTYSLVSGSWNMESMVFAFVEVVPSVAQSINFAFPVNLLLDAGSALTIAFGVADPTHATWMFTIAEVDDI